MTASGSSPRCGAEVLCGVIGSPFSLNRDGWYIPGRDGRVDDDQHGAVLSNLDTSSTAINDRQSDVDKPLADQIGGSAAFAQVGLAARAPGCVGHMDDLWRVGSQVVCPATKRAGD